MKLFDGPLCSIVEYRSSANAWRAIRDMNETNLDGRTIYVREVIFVIWNFYSKLFQDEDTPNGRSQNQGQG